MKSKRAEKYIREVYNMDGHGYNGGSYRAAEINNNHPKYAIQAVEWAEEDMLKKAENAFNDAISSFPVETDIYAIKEAKEIFIMSLNK